jgi:mitochondrial intermediate peptidase
MLSSGRLSVNRFLKSISSNHRSISNVLPSSLQTEQVHKVHPSNPSVGVMGVPFLSSSTSFSRAADVAIKVCDPLIKSIAVLPGQSANPPQPVVVLRTLDTISDTICKVLDAAECIRNVHSSSEWRDSADATFHSLSSYMFQLNAFVPLFQSLKRVTDDPAAMRGLSPEQVRMALMLRREFERDGIHLDAESRKEIVRLNEMIGQISSQFLSNISEGNSQSSTDDLEANANSHSGRIIQIAKDPSAVAEVLKHAPQAILRRNVMMAAATCASSQNIALLHQLRDARNQLAVRIGFPSYADLVASDRMAGNPENAIRFLQVLAKALRPRLLKELNALRASKASHASLKRDEVTLDAVSDQGVSKEHVTLNPWDVSFYTHTSVKDSFNGDSHTMASEYLPLSAVISGLQGIMRKVFGVTMVSVDLQPGESWTSATSSPSSSTPSSSSLPSPLKFVLRHDQEGALGTMYLDLFTRPGKFPGAAHFVVRCGKKIHEVDGGFEKAIGVATTQVPSVGGSLGQSFQLPIVTLVTNYANPLPSQENASSVKSVGDSSTQAATHAVLMTPQEVETLFHEFGHAIHSLFSRTEFQHLSGTRGALDFVELPSHLMEYFARDLRVVKSFAKHHITHAPMPDALWKQVQASRKAFSGIDLMQSINLSLFDQALFGSPSSVEKILKGGMEANTFGDAQHVNHALSTLSSEDLVIPMTPSSDFSSKTAEVEQQMRPYSNAVATTSSSIDSTFLLDAVHKQYSPVPHLEKSMFQASFAHAATYGAGYYTYVYATALSSAVWKKLFAKDPFDRKAGDLLRNEILSKGAGADPSKMITKVLGEKATMIALLEELELLEEKVNEEGSNRVGVVSETGKGA